MEYLDFAAKKQVLLICRIDFRVWDNKIVELDSFVETDKVQ